MVKYLLEEVNSKYGITFNPAEAMPRWAMRQAVQEVPVALVEYLEEYLKVQNMKSIGPLDL